MNENPAFKPEPNKNQEQSHPKSSLRSRLVGWGIAILAIGIVVALMLPALRNTRPAAHRSQCKYNLKQIGLALHNYHDTYGTFPPAYTVDEAGNRLHSWRVLILPFLEQQALYNEIDLTKPWNDPANELIRKIVVPGYRCPNQTGPETHTSYFAVVGDDYAFPSTRPREMGEIKEADGTANTVMVFEAPKNKTVEWMSPDDGEADLFLKFDKSTPTHHNGGGHILMVDGAVRFISNQSSQELRRALMTIAGGEKIGEEDL